MTAGPPGPGGLDVRAALQAAATQGVARLDAQLLLLHALGRPAAGRAWLAAHDDHALETPAAEAFAALCARRIAGEPLAYLVGEKEFFGLRLQVDARVLVPRPETELLVEWALELLAGHPAPAVLDLGTGSGAIAVAIALQLPQSQVAATDRSAAALEVARINAARHGAAVALRQGHWLRGDAGRYDLIVANPPYIAAADPHLPALRHEPAAALVAGPDGLDDLREIIAGAPAHLLPGGWLLLEHGWDQAGPVQALLRDAGLEQVQGRPDLAGIVRCAGARCR